MSSVGLRVDCGGFSDRDRTNEEFDGKSTCAVHLLNGITSDTWCKIVKKIHRDNRNYVWRCAGLGFNLVVIIYILLQFLLLTDTRNEFTPPSS